MDTETENYEPMLKESIKHFSAAYSKGNLDFSTFESIFFRKIQTMLDPPLEITWFYSAVTFHSAKLAQTNRHFGPVLLLVKDLFRLLTSCSQLSSGSKKIALLAPVVYELYNVVCESSRRALSLRKDVEELIEEIVGYISICCCNESENKNKCDGSVVCFDELVRVWTIDRVGEGEVSGFSESLGAFFLVLSGELVKGVDERCGIQCLAGIVLYEVFLLRLCLKFNTGVPREKLLAGLCTLSVQMIEGFKNCYFLDVLLRMLLEPTLSVNSLLCSEDVVLLRKILYDAVILIDYSFLHSDRWLQLHSNHLNNLALMWALAADAAVQFAREISDNGRIVSYANAFNNSHLLNQLIGWVSCRVGIKEKIRQNMSTPRALIDWLYFHQDQGIGVFDHNVSTILKKVAITRSRSELELPNLSKYAQNLKGSFLSNSRDDDVNEDIVNMETEMFEPLNSANPAGLCMAISGFTVGTRKRKEGMMFEVGETRAKLVKCDLHEKAVCSDKFGGGSEVGNPGMEDDVEVMVTG